jgi:pimeloyl-ACP methyl ester carboxylesterase
VLTHVNAPDGVSIACERAGSGPPLVLVHGAGSARWGFDALRPLLEDSFTVIAVDRRGRGDSGDGDAGYALAQEFEDVAAVVEAAGEGALLFGHSFGGLVAAGAAALLPGLPKLALYEPPMGGVLAAEPWIERFEERVAAGDRPAAVREFLRDVGGYGDDDIDAMQETAAWGARLAAAPTVPRELRAELGLDLDALELLRLELPCLMLVGSESPGWARRSAEAYAAALPEVSLHVLDGEGHGATVSAPERVAAELKRFFATA